MTRRRAPDDVRRLALVWCWDHLDDGLDDVRLAALWLQDRLDRGQQAGTVPPNLLAALDTEDARLALEGLEADRLLYRRHHDGYQLTDAGLVLGRAMKEATLTAQASVPVALVQDPRFLPVLRQELEGKVGELLEEHAQQESRRLLEGTGSGTPRGLMSADDDAPLDTLKLSAADEAFLEERERSRAEFQARRRRRTP